MYEGRRTFLVVPRLTLGKDLLIRRFGVVELVVDRSKFHCGDDGFRLVQAIEWAVHRPYSASCCTCPVA